MIFYRKSNKETDRLILLKDILEENIVNDDIYTIARRINEKLYNYFRIDISSIYSYNEKRKTFNLLHSTKDDKITNSSFSDILGAEKTNVVVLNYKNPPRSEIYFPMTIDSSIVGLVIFESAIYNNFADFDISFFYIIQKNIALILQNKMYMDKIKRMALVDSLTGAYNRNYLNEFIKKECDHLMSLKQEGCLVMYDIDYFKKYNDTYGHDVGDKVLKSVTDIVKNHIRNTDSLIRFGGEEFLIFIPNINKDTCYRNIETIRQYIHNETGVTCSFGISCFPEHGHVLEGLIKKADIALYVSKKSGRNTTTLYKKEMDNNETASGKHN